MSTKDWIELGIVIVSYALAIIAGVYAKNKAKINKTTAAGKALDLVGQLATYAVHETESMDLTNAQKRKAAVEIINQGLAWFGIKNVTPNTITGAIEKAVNAMHLANSVDPTESEIAKDVSADELLQPTVKPEQQKVANFDSNVKSEQNTGVVKNG